MSMLTKWNWLNVIVGGGCLGVVAWDIANHAWLWAVIELFLVALNFGWVIYLWRKKEPVSRISIDNSLV